MRTTARAPIGQTPQAQYCEPSSGPGIWRQSVKFSLRACVRACGLACAKSPRLARCTPPRSCSSASRDRADRAAAHLSRWCAGVQGADHHRVGSWLWLWRAVAARCRFRSAPPGLVFRWRFRGVCGAVSAGEAVSRDRQPCQQYAVLRGAPRRPGGLSASTSSGPASHIVCMGRVRGHSVRVSRNGAFRRGLSWLAGL